MNPLRASANKSDARCSRQYSSASQRVITIMPRTRSTTACAGRSCRGFRPLFASSAMNPQLRRSGRSTSAKADCLPDWIICGGESGGAARVMDPAWARHVLDQCRALGIPEAVGHLPEQSPGAGARARSGVTRKPTAKAAPCSMVGCIATSPASGSVSSARECPSPCLGNACAHDLQRVGQRPRFGPA
jgi:hypothetical protein